MSQPSTSRTPLLRSDRIPAGILLAAAALGLIIANSPLGPAVQAVQATELGGGILRLSAGHWIADGLLAVFFFVVAVELQWELTSGQLNSPKRALQPAIAAAGGVLVPIAVYLLIAGGETTSAGWPIPTATDIAFALGVLAVFGRGLPSGLRIFLLALAILDDIVGIVFIAVLFTTDIDFGMLIAALVAVVAFGALSRTVWGRWRAGVVVLLVVLALTAWVCMHLSGVHATIAGVLLGLAMAQRPAMLVRHALEPWVNGLVLPLFAFSAALVTIPRVAAAELSPALWGVLIALPVGKIIGITAAGWIAVRFANPPGAPRLAIGDLLAAGALGGIGFTVSLLLSELAFAGDAATRDQATLGVLGGSGISLVLAGVLVSARARWHRRRNVATAEDAGG